MGKNLYIVLAVLTAVTAVSAVGFGFRGYYLLGMPIGEAKVTEYTTYYGGYSIKYDVDMRNGFPLKMGMTNLGVGAVINFVPLFGIEGGLEVHTKYNNKSATVSGTVGYGGYENFLSGRVPEDQIKWKMNNIYAGARFNLPLRGIVRPYANGGFLFVMGKGVALDDGTETDDYVKGTNRGVYFGFGTNIFVSKEFAISIPIKYHMPFTGTYQVYENGYEAFGFKGRLKPPAFFAVGAGVEIHVI
jgi:hypothetical protein